MDVNVGDRVFYRTVGNEEETGWGKVTKVYDGKSYRTSLDREFPIEILLDDGGFGLISFEEVVEVESK